MMNKETAESIFNSFSCLVKDQDVMPIDIAKKFTSDSAIDFVRGMDRDLLKGYGIGKCTMRYITKRGFFLAVTYSNVEFDANRCE